MRKPPATPRWVIPSNQIYCNALALPSGFDLPEGYYVLLFAPDSSAFTLRPEASFIQNVIHETYAGYATWAIQVSSNTGPELHGSVVLTSPSGTVRIPIVQQSGAAITALTTNLLTPPPSSERFAFPLAMELGVAGKFIAGLLKKIPLPYRVLAYVAVAVAIVGLAATVALARAAFVTVPEPPNYFQPGSQIVTVELIEKQSGLLIQYILQETFT